MTKLAQNERAVAAYQELRREQLSYDLIEVVESFFSKMNIEVDIYERRLIREDFRKVIDSFFGK